MPRFYTFRALFLAGALGEIAGAFAAAASLSVLDVTPIGSTCRSLLAMQQWQAREDAQGRDELEARVTTALTIFGGPRTQGLLRSLAAEVIRRWGTDDGWLTRWLDRRTT